MYEDINGNTKKVASCKAINSKELTYNDYLNLAKGD